jgi:hypothetical protein
MATVTYDRNTVVRPFFMNNTITAGIQSEPVALALSS